MALGSREVSRHVKATRRPVGPEASPRAGLLLRARCGRLAVLLLCAIASQVLLPLAHASARFANPASSSGVLAPTHSAPVQGIEVSRAAAPANHDPAACGVCQSLLHAKPVASPPAVAECWLPELASLFIAPVVRSHAAVARTGHPPRAPPLVALSLA